jgi:hypothetical protein
MDHYNICTWSISGALSSINIYTSSSTKPPQPTGISTLPSIVSHLISRINKLSFIIVISLLVFFFIFVVNDMVTDQTLPTWSREYTYVFKVEMALIVLILMAILVFWLWGK